MAWRLETDAYVLSSFIMIDMALLICLILAIKKGFREFYP